MPKFCENCGKEIPDNSGFCPECGAQQTTISTFKGFEGNPNLNCLIITGLTIFQIILWNLKSVKVSSFFLSISFSLNDILSGVGEIGSMMDNDSVKSLKFINVCFYLLMALMVIISLYSALKGKMNVVVPTIIEVILGIALIGTMIYVSIKSGDYVDISFTFVYWLLILSSVIQIFLPFILNRR